MIRGNSMPSPRSTSRNRLIGVEICWLGDCGAFWRAGSKSRWVYLHLVAQTGNCSGWTIVGSQAPLCHLSSEVINSCFASSHSVFSPEFAISLYPCRCHLLFMSLGWDIDAGLLCCHSLPILCSDLLGLFWHVHPFLAVFWFGAARRHHNWGLTWRIVSSIHYLIQLHLCSDGVHRASLHPFRTQKSGSRLSRIFRILLAGRCCFSKERQAILTST